jgi:hypothetical protein
LKDVEVVPSAVWKVNDANLFCADWASGVRISSEPCGPRIPAVRLSEWMTETVDLLRLDVGGAEFDVVEGLRDAGAFDRIRRIVAEVHVRSENQAKLASLLTALADSGFGYALSRVRYAPELSDRGEPTGFRSPKDARCSLYLHAWKADT